MPEYIAYHNGNWKPSSQVSIQPNDRGLTLGDSVYDALRTFNGECYKVQAHVDRLYRSLKSVGIDAGISPDEMFDLINQSCARNEHLREKAGDHRVWIWISRGPGRWAHTAGPPTVIILVSPSDFGRFAHLYESGAHGIIPDILSYPVTTLDPRIKHTSRMNFNLAEIEVAKIDPEAWPILTDTEGHVTEGTSYNVFIVKNEIVQTPFIHALLRGISRETIFEIADELKIPSQEKMLRPDDLHNADEIFFTGTTMCILAVTRLNGKSVGDSKPGKITMKLLSKWSEIVGVDIVKQAIKFAKR